MAGTSPVWVPPRVQLIFSVAGTKYDGIATAEATKVNGILHLGFGTGERANMNCNSTTDGCTLFNRYYILKDRDVWETATPSTIDGRGVGDGGRGSRPARDVLFQRFAL